MKTEFWVTNFAAPGGAGRIAKLYEDAGWDGLLFTDSQHHNGDVYQSLAIASVATEHIGLGTGVTNPLTRNAAVTAAAILSVQVESDGRATLGIGRGDSSLGHLGLRPASVAVLEDYVAKVQGYLRGEAVVQNNHPAHLKWIEGIPKPPVDIAATGPRVSGVAGRVADSITVAVGADAERMQRNIDRAREARDAAGLDPATLATGAYLNVAAHPDAAVARRVVRGSIGTMAHFSSMPGAPLDEVGGHRAGRRAKRGRALPTGTPRRRPRGPFTRSRRCLHRQVRRGRHSAAGGRSSRRNAGSGAPRSGLHDAWLTRC